MGRLHYKWPFVGSQGLAEDASFGGQRRGAHRPCPTTKFSSSKLDRTLPARLTGESDWLLAKYHLIGPLPARSAGEQVWLLAKDENTDPCRLVRQVNEFARLLAPKLLHLRTSRQASCRESKFPVVKPSNFRSCQTSWQATPDLELPPALPSLTCPQKPIPMR